MGLESMPDSNIPTAIPLRLAVEGAGGIMEALSSNISVRNEEQLNSILRMASMNANMASGVMQSTIIEKYSNLVPNMRNDASVGVSNLSLPMEVYFQGHGTNNKEPYFSIPSSPMPLSHDDPANSCFSAERFSQLYQGAQRAGRIQHFGNTKASSDLSYLRSQICRESVPVKTKQEVDPLAQMIEMRRCDVNKDNIQQQQLMQELLLKELQERNPQVKAMLMQHRLQSQIQQPILDSAPQIRGLQLKQPKPLIRNTPQEQSNQQVSLIPALDGGICSRRVMQYLYHMRNRPHENRITFWKTLVSEYFAPGSRKRWCFSKYENVEQHAAGVFCSKSKEIWCCDLCGSRSGKGLEATFEIFPRLFKIKFESGVLDEILFLDSPRARKLPSGSLMLEYGKAIQESVYERFRVIHEGVLRIVFRQDLKMLSWEFCTRKHEEFLLRRLVAPQVDQLLQAAQKYHNDVQNGDSAEASSDDLQTNCDRFVSAGQQLARNVELPLVNDLGYPKRFIRCLQIAEVVNSMQDLIGFSQDQKMGPIESLNNYSQGRHIVNQINEKQEKEHLMEVQYARILQEHPSPAIYPNGPRVSDNSSPSPSGKSSLALTNLNHQFLGQSSSSASNKRRKVHESCFIDSSFQSRGSSPQTFNPYSFSMSQPSGCNNTTDQALIDKLIAEMVASSTRNSMQDTYGRPSKEVVHHPCTNGSFSSLLSGVMDSQDASARVNVNPSYSLKTAIVPKVGSRGNFSAVRSSIIVKAEPRSPEDAPEAGRKSTTGSSRSGDMNR